jgi:hypothetical protein
MSKKTLAEQIKETQKLLSSLKKEQLEKEGLTVYIDRPIETIGTDYEPTFYRADALLNEEDYTANDVIQKIVIKVVPLTKEDKRLIKNTGASFEEN